MTEDEINQYFISAVNQYLSERDVLIENAQTILELLSDTTELERQLDKCKKKLTRQK